MEKNRIVSENDLYAYLRAYFEVNALKRYGSIDMDQYTAAAISFLEWYNHVNNTKCLNFSEVAEKELENYNEV